MKKLLIILLNLLGIAGILGLLVALVPWCIVFPSHEHALLRFQAGGVMVAVLAFVLGCVVANVAD